MGRVRRRETGGLYGFIGRVTMDADTGKLVGRTARMMDKGEVTRLLELWRGGEEGAFDRLLPLVYDELRRVATAYMRRERSDHTMQTTALIHEAYLRLADVRNLEVNDRSHFFAVAARAMRRILVDHARSQQSAKRVGAHRRLPLEEAAAMPLEVAPGHVIAVHEALEKLAAAHPRQAQLVEMRFFGGFSEDEVGEILGLSRSTMTRDWRFARQWLRRHMEPD